MTDIGRSPQEALFEEIAGAELALEGTRRGRMFGSDGLLLHDRLYAVLSRGRLVVKLPEPRTSDLVEAGEGERFEPGPGHVMREWLSTDLADEDDADRWRTLVADAREYSASLPPKVRKPRRTAS